MMRLPTPVRVRLRWIAMTMLLSVAIATAGIARDDRFLEPPALQPHSAPQVLVLPAGQGLHLAYRGADAAGHYTAAAVGDFNGNARTDIVVGMPDATEAGSVFVVFGQRARPGTLDLDTLDGLNGFRINGAQAGDGFGLAVAGAGDFNGNGYADIAIGVPRARHPESGRVTGAVYIIHGRDARAAPYPPVLELARLDENQLTVIYGDPDSRAFGTMLAHVAAPAAGDRSTLLIADPEYRDTAGRALGRVHRLTADGDTTVLLGDPAFAGLGQAVVPLGDYTGNGWHDFALGTAGKRGAVYVVQGRESWPDRIDLARPDRAGALRISMKDDPGWGLGRAIAYLPARAHGEDEFLALGLPAHGSPTWPATGAAVLLSAGEMPDNGLLRLEALHAGHGLWITGTVPGESLGLSLAGIDDFTRDGYPELLLGSHELIHADPASAFAGMRLLSLAPWQAPVRAAQAGETAWPARPDSLEILAERSLNRGPEPAAATGRWQVASAGRFSGRATDHLMLISPAAGGEDGAGIYIIFGTGGALLINGGAGFEDQTAIHGQIREIPFTVTHPDPDIAPDQFEVFATSLSPDTLPDTALELSGAAEDWLLRIDTGAAEPENAEILVVATLAGDQPTEETFSIEILLPGAGPLINDGAGIADQAAMRGEQVAIAFDVTHPQVPPDEFEVDVTSLTPGLLPQAALQLTGAGESWSLAIDTVPAQPGMAQVEVTASFPGGDVTSTIFNFNLAPYTGPVINGGAGFGDLALMLGDSATVDFVLADPVFDPAALTVTAASGTPAVLPDSALALSGTGAAQTLEIQTAGAGAGQTVIAVSVNNPLLDFTLTETFVLTLSAAGGPLINNGAGIPAHSVVEGGTVSIAFAVSDPQDPPGALAVTASSGNPQLLPQASLSLGGAGGQRTLVIQTPPGSSGAVPVTVSVTNTAGVVTASTFVLSILPRGAPSINDGEPIEDQRVTVGETLEVPFTVADPGGTPGTLIVAARWDDDSGLPDDAITLGGSGAQRVLVVDTTGLPTGTWGIVVTATNDAGLTTESRITISITDAPARLSLSGAPVDAPGADRFIRFDVTGLGSNDAVDIIFQASVPPGVGVVGGYSLAAACDIVGDAVLCDPSQIAPWHCQADDNTLHCALPALPAGGTASLVLHTHGPPGGNVNASAGAANADIVTTEVGLDD